MLHVYLGVPHFFIKLIDYFKKKKKKKTGETEGFEVIANIPFVLFCFVLNL
jgi:hypothetical protein